MTGRLKSWSYPASRVGADAAVLGGGDEPEAALDWDGHINQARAQVQELQDAADHCCHELVVVLVPVAPQGGAVLVVQQHITGRHKLVSAPCRQGRVRGSGQCYAAGAMQACILLSQTSSLLLIEREYPEMCGCQLKSLFASRKKASISVRDLHPRRLLHL